MDMTGSDSKQVNLRHEGLFQWDNLEARAYNERTRHKMNFFEDKAFWYRGNAPGMPMDTKGKNTGAAVKADIALSESDILNVGGEYQRYRFSDWWDPSVPGGMYPNRFDSINDGERDRYAVFAERKARWNSQWLGLFGMRSETVKMDTGVVQGYNSGYDNNWNLNALARKHLNSVMPAKRARPVLRFTAAGAYVGQGTTMPPSGGMPYGIAAPGMGRSSPRA